MGRRFSDLGSVRWREHSARLIDDYGHHPTEVAVTLKAARDAFAATRVVMVYQPHRFTRTRDHFDEFVSVLGENQVLILLDVYAAGESPIDGADSQALANAIRSRGVVDPIVVSDQATFGGGINERPRRRRYFADAGCRRHWSPIDGIGRVRNAGGAAVTATTFNGMNLAVLLGGNAAEREISLESGANVAECLEQAGAVVSRVDPAVNGWQTRLKDAAFVFNLLHGPGGEDGTLQGLLEFMGLPYSGCGVLASALTMDKIRTKLLWQGAMLKTPPFKVLTVDSDWQAVIDELGSVFVKPALEGSSLGMSRADSATAIEGGL